MAGQLNQTVAAPPVRTSFRHDEARADSGIAWPWLKHTQDMNVAVNKAPQMREDIPVSSTSPGTIGAIAFDENFLYFCVAENTWRRVAWAAF